MAAGVDPRKAKPPNADARPKRYGQYVDGSGSNTNATDRYIEYEKAARHFMLVSRLINCLGWAIVIAAMAIPIWFVQPLAHSLARHGNGNGAILAASLIFNGILIGATSFQYTRRRSMTRKIRGQRRRLDKLERLLAENVSPRMGSVDEDVLAETDYSFSDSFKEIFDAAGPPPGWTPPSTVRRRDEDGR